MIATGAGIALFLWAYSTFCTSVFGAGKALWQRRRSRAARVRPSLRALVVRPCAGQEPELGRALTSLAGARSGASLACRIAVQSDADPAAEVAAEAAARLGAAGLDAAVALTFADAPNHKAAQIDAVLAREAASFDVVVIADSDVDLDGFDLDALIAPLEGDGAAGAVWAPPVEAGPIRGPGDRAAHALLGGSLHAFTLLGALDGRGLVGKLFAARLDALRAAGGFGAVSRVLGEDTEMGRRLIGAGWAVRAAPVVARSLKSGRSWAASVDRYARWLSVIRAHRPGLLVSYPLLFLAAPIILILAAVLAVWAPALALASAGAAVAARLVAALAARALSGARASLPASIRDAALSDALLARALARALTSRTLTWRGRTLTFGRGGALSA